MPLPPGIYRADSVGSFLRPQALLSARGDASAGSITPQELRRIEDEHVAAVVKSQVENGLRSVTDGEFRRAYFHIDFCTQLDGVSTRGFISSTNVTPHQDGLPTPPRLVVTGKLGHPRPIQVDDFRFLDAQLEKLGLRGSVSAKVCIPSPTMLHFRADRESIDRDAYPTLEPFFDDLARVYREELADLYAAGCRTCQLDDTNLAYLCDEVMREEAAARHGVRPDDLLDTYVRLINAAVSGRPRDMTVAIHLCRGNYRSQHFARGGYEPVARELLRRLDADAYLLEYDDDRSGDFRPLRHLPPGRTVVLGLMSSKARAPDDRARVLRRLREAAAYCPGGLDQLCLSHQCGFSSTVEGNILTEEEQWAKVRLEVDIAKEVWGDDLSK